jgi:hypothetical protein
VRAALLAGVLVLSGLTGCSSDTDAYCDALGDEREALDALARSSDKPDADMFASGLDVFDGLRQEAPDDIRDEWDTFYFAWEGVADAFERAGVTPQEYRSGETAGVGDAEAKAIEDAAAELGSQRVVEAGQGIEQHARDVCKVDLGL